MVSTLSIQSYDKITERKIRYDSVVVEHSCRLLKEEKQYRVLFHKIQDPFTMIADQTKLTIPKGSYTIAYYWRDRPYNLYIWRDDQGKYLGAYFNIVKNTYMTEKLVSFEDLIIDIMVIPTGDCFILDEDELPVPLSQFEEGIVQQNLNSLMNTIDSILAETIAGSENDYKHEDLRHWLNQG
ncbi:putative RNA-binding protein associated with RNAse of E/G family [Bacillus pakistanensis]|uniref:RNA-binding protein associated with RNAse of E/G family n=1 Tax=Rossellomorea pakistanensis TaxID=992288 RepID=A0ABS2NCC4_9BACI|nr:DUF402 domain-containing protein [Bacillus pakistanensis]MBM7585512.1 putative RNA-binding protein associated with RNAse of E/G family [Bacillus pakistanensis]